MDEATTAVAWAQVRAVHDAWHANTVRLQIEQDKLTSADGSCSVTSGVCLAYYQEIQAVTNLALGLGLTVVINDDTEPVPGFPANEPMPTRATEVFWKDIAAVYAGNPRVIFDLFNEPHVPGGDGASQWRLWRDGGQIGQGSYLGMQTVLSYIRTTLRATNMVWAEGLDAAGTLNGIASHSAAGTVEGARGSVGGFALSQAGDAVTGPLVYSFHHPDGLQTTTAWWRDFGYLAAQGYAVVDGEWNSAVDNTDYCWESAPTAIPAYLKYLAAKHIGLTAWELGPKVFRNVTPYDVTWSQSAPFDYTNPVLAGSPTSYETPTTLTGNPSQPWGCPDSNNAGPGQLLRDWFASQGG